MDPTLYNLLESTREQARAETERLNIESNRSNDEKKRLELEEERVKILREVSVKMTTILNLVQNVLIPSSHRTSNQNDLIIEVLRIIASIYSSISQEDAEQMEKLINKMIAKSPKITVGTNLISESDMQVNGNIHG